jgi:hypothetical protein
MKATGRFKDIDLDQFERDLEYKLGIIHPDSFFRNSLRERLESSRVFQVRKYLRVAVPVVSAFIAGGLAMVGYSLWRSRNAKNKISSAAS